MSQPIKYKAPNGKILIARNKLQAKAFEKAGMKPVDAKEAKE